MAFLRRVPFFLSLYLLASFLIFAAVEAIPGDPIALRFGKTVSAERVELERERLGFNEPWLVRYAMSQGRFLSGDWGKSLSTGRETVDDVKLFMPATVELSGLAMVIGVSVGLAVALFAALGTHPWCGRAAHFFASIGLVVPIFWIGIALLIVGALWLQWFPMGGRFSMAGLAPQGATGLYLLDTLLSGDFRGFGMALRHLALPSICLAFFPAASVSSVTYARLQEPELQAFTTALKARGFSTGRILWRHLLRVAAGPTVTVVGTSFGALLGGAFLTETVFSWPGVGRYLVSAILSRDVFVAQNLLTFLVLLVIAVAFVSDLVVWRLDPKRDEGSLER